LENLHGKVEKVVASIDAVHPRGPRDPESSAYIGPARERIRLAVNVTITKIKMMLEVYNEAYSGLTNDGNPGGFRDFLLTAPAMFMSLGEQLGAVQHIVSYWTHKFPPGRPTIVSPPELMDFLLDFEDSLSFAEEQGADTAAA
jgi:hypothetical protein